MAVSNAQRLAKAKYQHEKRALVASEVSKEKRDEYKAAAVKLGLSLSMLIQNGVEEFIERHGGEVVARSVPSKEERLSSADKRLVEEFNQLPDDIKPTVRKLIQQINQNSPK